jgi:hypothetical protein
MINIIFLRYFIRYIPVFKQVEDVAIHIFRRFTPFKPCQYHTTNTATCTVFKDKLGTIKRLLIYLRELVYICQMNPFHTGKKTKSVPLPASDFKIIFVVRRTIRKGAPRRHAGTEEYSQRNDK